MAPFRPNNVNRRLVSDTGGNAGVVGPTKCPFTPLPLGGRCDNLPACGRFRISESYCQTKCPCADCRGIFICCGPGTNKWFIAPSCTEEGRDWYNRNATVTNTNSTMGACGWFVPDIGQIDNPGYCCRSYWDSYQNQWYWSNTPVGGGYRACAICMQYGLKKGTSGYDPATAPVGQRSNTWCVRSFRCTAT